MKPKELEKYAKYFDTDIYELIEHEPELDLTENQHKLVKHVMKTTEDLQKKLGNKQKSAEL
jgi:hypothetical protein